MTKEVITFAVYANFVDAYKAIATSIKMQENDGKMYMMFTIMLSLSVPRKGGISDRAPKRLELQ
jgi:hypothetical protein